MRSQEKPFHLASRLLSHEASLVFTGRPDVTAGNWGNAAFVLRVGAICMSVEIKGCLCNVNVCIILFAWSPKKINEKFAVVTECGVRIKML